MTKTIAVLAGDKKNEYNVLVNYVKRGVTLHNMDFANREAIKISGLEPYDHLILAKEIKES